MPKYLSNNISQQSKPRTLLGETPRKNYLQISEAARSLGVSIDTVRRWDKMGILASNRLDGKNRYFSREDIKKLQENKELSVSDASEHLGISVSTLRRLDKKGDLIGGRNNRNERVYTLAQLEEYITNKKNPSRKSQSFPPPDSYSNTLAAVQEEISSDQLVKNHHASRQKQNENLIHEEELEEKTNTLKNLFGQISFLKLFRFEPRSIFISQISSIKQQIYLLKSSLVVGTKRSLSNLPPILLAHRRSFTIVILLLILLPSSKYIFKVSNSIITHQLESGGSGQKIISNTGSVLAEATRKISGNISFNIPSIFNEHVDITNTLSVADLATFSANITAPNVIYSVASGSGILIGPGQNPSITNLGVLTIAGSNGDITLGSGLSMSDRVFTNSDTGSAQKIFKTIKIGSDTFSAGSNTDTLTFASGTGISLSIDTSNKKVSISNSGIVADPGWTDDGATVRLTTSTDNVGIGTTSPNAKLDVSGTFKVSGTTTLNSVAYTWPSADGSNNYVLSTNASGTLSWQSVSVVGATNYWSLTNGSLYPINETLDLFVGGTTTASAKFAVLNINSGTPTASVSAGTSGAAYLNASGKLATTNAQSLTIGDSTTTGNVIINPSGNIGIGGTTPGTKLDVTGTGRFSQTLTATSGFTLSSGALNLTTTSGLATLTLSSSQNALNINSGLFNVDTANSRVGIGITAPLEKLDVSGNATIAGNLTFSGARTIASRNMTTLTIGDNNTGNILFNPAGQTQFYSSSTYFGTSGQLNVGSNLTVSGTSNDIAGTLNLSGNNLTSSTNLTINPLSGHVLFGSGVKLTIGGSGAQNYNIIGDSTAGVFTTDITSVNDLYVKGNVEIDGTLRLGNNTYTWPSSGQSSGFILTTNGSGTLSWAGPLTLSSSFWNQSSGALYPFNSTVDLLVGGQSTSSAKFAVLNINSGTPTASVSATSTGTGLSIAGDGTIQSAINGTMAIGGSTTGNIALMPLNGTGNVGIGTSSPANTLDIDASTDTNLRIRTNSGAAFGPRLNLDNQGTSGRSYTILSTGSSNSGGAGLLQFYDNTASSVRAVFDANGNLGVGNNTTVGSRVVIKGTGATSATSSLNVTNSSNVSLLYVRNDGNVGINNTSPLEILDVVGNATVSGNLTFGGASTIASRKSSLLTIGDSLTGDILLSPGTGKKVQFFSSSNTIDSSGNLTIAGTTTFNTQTYTWPSGGQSSGFVLTTNGSGTLSWAATGGASTNYWNLANGSLYPINQTLDLLIGGTTTASAKFSVLNMNSGTPTASVSATSTGAGLSFTGDGTIQSLQNGILTIGGNTTGDVLLSPGTGKKVQFFSSSNTIDSSGVLTIASNLVLSNSAATTTFGGITYTWPTSGQANNFVLSTNGSGTLSWAAVAGVNSVNYWNLTNGAFYPINATADLFVGGTSTASAKFAVLNINSGTPTASVSAISSNTGAYIAGDGTISSVNKGTLTLGGSNTGNITIDSGSDVLTFSDPSIKLSGTNPSITNTATGSTLSIAANGTGTLTLNSGATGNIQLFSSSNTLTSAGVLTIASNLVLSNSAATTQFGGIAYTWPSSQTGGYALTTNGSGTLSWTAISTGTNMWASSNGALYPINSTLDLFIGGQSTAAAKFAVLNMNSGTPTASVSAQNGSAQALVLGGDETIQSVRNHTLTIGGSTTGNIALLPLNSTGNVGINTSTPGTTLDVTGTGRFSSTLTASNGFTLTTGALSLTSTSGTAALTLSSSTTAFNVNSGLFDIDTTNSRVGIGTAAPNDKLDVVGDATHSGNLTFYGGARTIASRTSNQLTIGDNATGDILFSPGSGKQVRFYDTNTYIDSTGKLVLAGLIDANGTGTHDIAGTLNLSGNNLTSSTNLTINPLSGHVLFGSGVKLTIGGSGAQNYNIIGDSTAGVFTTDITSVNDLYVKGNVEIDGTLRLGNNTYTWPSSGQSSGYVLSTNGSGTLSWSVAGVNYWDQTNGALYPQNTTVDLLVGGTSTASSKFGFININSGSPTATISSNFSLVVPTSGTAGPSIQENILNGGSWNLRTSVGGDAGLSNRLAITNGGALLATGDTTLGATPTSGAGTRMMWIPAKAAFRAGAASSTEWDDVNIGLGSIALGRSGPKASGTDSIAIGTGSIASGLNSIALGGTANSSNSYSLAIGQSTIASGYGSLALGANSIATGQYSHAVGYDNTTSGTESFAFGSSLTAGSASYAMAIGHGVDISNHLVNNIANSLAIGFNSTIPTLYVGPSSGVGTTGNVGIATTSPNAPLHVSGTSAIFGVGEGGTPTATTIRGAAASGSDIAGANLTFDASNGTGQGGSGALIFRTAPATQTAPSINNYSSISGSASSITLNNFTVGSGSNRLLVVEVAQWVVSTTVSSITYGGISLTKAGSVAHGTSAVSDIWYLVAPTSGTANVVVTFSAATDAEIIASDWTNVNQSTPVGTFASATGTSASPSVSVTSSSNDTVIDLLASYVGDSTTVGNGQTQIANVASGNIRASASYKIAASTMSWTKVSSAENRWAIAALPIKAVSGQAASTTADTLAERMRIDSNGNVGIGTSSPSEKLHISGGNVLIGPQTDNSPSFSLLNSTPGIFGSDISIQGASSSAVFNGKLYVTTSKTDSAAVYRYDGGKTWTKVTDVTSGKIVTADTANIDSIVLTVFNGILYAGTRTGSGTNTGAVYSYNGTAWALINTTRGTFASQTNVDDVSDLIVYNGNLYASTGETNLAGVYRYDGSASFVRVNNVEGKCVGADGAIIDSGVLAVWDGYLAWGTKTGAVSNAANVCMFTGADDGLNAVKLSSTNGTFGSVTFVDDVTALAVYNGSLFVAVSDGANTANIFRVKSSGFSQISSATTANWEQTTTTTGRIDATNDATDVDQVITMRVYNGRLYAGSLTSAADGTGALYEYQPISWTRINTARGTFGSQTGVDAVVSLTEYNGTLYVGTDEPAAGSVYSLTKLSSNSYALRFDSGSSNYGAITFVGSQNASTNEDNTGNFIFSHSLATTTGAYDVAEDYPTRDDTLSSGDIVAIDKNEEGFVKKAEGAYSSETLGVYSQKPGLRLSQKDGIINGARAVPIALAGRVPVKIASSSAKINPGDFITQSNEKGKGMKAEKAGYAIGKVLESWSKDSGKDTVLVFISSGYHIPSYLTANGNLQIIKEGYSSNSDRFIVIDQDGQLVDNNKIFSDITAANITAGSVDAKTVLTNSLRANEALFKNLSTSSLIGDTLTIHDQINSDTIVTNQIRSGNLSIDLTLDSLTIATSSTSALFALNKYGDSTISGKLSAKEIKADKATLETLLVKNLIVDNIETQASSSSLFNIGNLGIKTDFAELSLATIKNGLTVLGTSTLNEATVENTLTIGSNLKIEKGSINTIGSDLEIQPLKQNNISLMSGLITIDTTGHVKFSENVEFEKDVKVAGILSATSIKGINDNLSVSGGATFERIQFVTNAPQIISDSEVIATASAGVIKLKANKEFIKIRNDKVSINSLIYITPKTGTSGQSLFIKEQKEGDSFTVGIDNPVSKDIEFNYLIVN